MRIWICQMRTVMPMSLRTRDEFAKGQMGWSPHGTCRGAMDALTALG